MSAGVERVLFVSSSPWLGGGNRFLIATGKEMQRRGIVVGIAFLSTGPAIAEARRVGLETLSWTIAPPDYGAPLQSARGLARSVRLLHSWCPDIVHGNDIAATRSVAVASRFVRAGLVCHLHRPQHLSAGEVAWAFQRLPSPHVILDVSQERYDQNEGVLKRAVPAIRHTLLRNGIDLAEFTPGNGRGSATPRVGCVSNTLPIKRLEDLVEMMARLSDRHPDLELWLIGDDSIDPEYTSSLHSLRNRLGLQDRVRFVGRRDDIAALLRELDVFVHASSTEGCPLAVFEAMATGLPVVATKVGTVGELMEDGVDAMLLPPGRPDLFAQRVDQLVRDPSARLRLGQAGRRRVEELFDIRTTVDSLLEIYKDAVSRSIEPRK